MDYRGKLAEIDTEIRHLHRTRKSILKNWVEKHHPLNVGDIVETNYYGGKKMVVDNLNISAGGGFWEASGKLIKKNGQAGKAIGTWIQAMKG